MLGSLAMRHLGNTYGCTPLNKLSIGKHANVVFRNCNSTPHATIFLKVFVVVVVVVLFCFFVCLFVCFDKNCLAKNKTSI